MEKFGRSLASDSRLVTYDLRACLAHVTMLTEVGVISGPDSATLTAALEAMLADPQPGGDHEDIHSWVEAELAARVGPLASSIRVGRSRNDLVVTDFRLWTKDQVRRSQSMVRWLQTALLEQARAHPQTYLPGYTHLQRAQPVLLAHHLLAHFWSLERDYGRLERVYHEADCCALGAGALAGSSWPIRPERTAELLGFSRHFDNSLDAVSDRDFAVEYLAAAALCGVHLSRLAEELVLWTTPEFGFATLDDAWATGSSLMPQKKNPDPAELVRGRSGRLIGHLMSLLATLKALPLAYNRDLQEDKPPVFEAADTLDACLEVMAGTVGSLTFVPAGMAAACADPGLLATDLADGLVRAGHPFAKAHELAGKSVAGRLDAEEQALVDPILAKLDARSVLTDRAHPGAAGPASVAVQLEKASALLG